jgi:hypothetical protein
MYEGGYQFSFVGKILPVKLITILNEFGFQNLVSA